MKYETKFSLGDRVWAVDTTEFRRIVRCKPCANTGKIEIAGESLVCPKCSGRATHAEYAGKKHYVSEFDALVGKISIEHVDSLFDWASAGSEPRVSYMISATGVGTGLIWNEDRLFSSEQKAQEFCQRMNNLLPADECEDGQPLVDPYGKVL